MGNDKFQLISSVCVWRWLVRVWVLAPRHICLFVCVFMHFVHCVSSKRASVVHIHFNITLSDNLVLGLPIHIVIVDNVSVFNATLALVAMPKMVWPSYALAIHRHITTVYAYLWGHLPVLWENNKHLLFNWSHSLAIFFSRLQHRSRWRHGDR